MRQASPRGKHARRHRGSHTHQRIAERVRGQLWQLTAKLAPRLAQAKHDDPTLQRVHLVPLGDAHALPWANAASDVLGANATNFEIRQYPSLSAFTHARVFLSEPSAPAVTRVALAHDEACGIEVVYSDRQGRKKRRSAHLPMVALEVALSQQIWRQGTAACEPVCLPAMTPQSWPPEIAPSDAVQALIGMGHGGAPAGNWTRSGLWMPSWPHAAASIAPKQSYLSASELPGLAHVERLFMSCCVLGRTDDQVGEPLGLLALAFGVRTRVAVGSLLSVDDACALLISLAFQWRVARASAVDWVAEFHALRGELKRGHWPEGFGPWLEASLIELACHGTMPARHWRGLMRLALRTDVPVIELARQLACAVPVPVARSIDWFVALG